MFDWLHFLRVHRIPYVASGHSVVRGNIACRCPWCGANDPSTHMGISLHGKGWGCWRSRAHRGVSPIRLVQGLIHCTWIEAQRIVENETTGGIAAPANFLESVTELLSPTDRPRSVSDLQFPDSIAELRYRGLARTVADYLVRRGYQPNEIDDLCKTYGLRYAMSGYFSYRLIFPVYGIEKLQTWTGRSIDSLAQVRYLTLSPDQEKMAKAGMPAAACSIKDLIWQLPALLNDDYMTVVVVEGPFDALRVDWYGRPYGIRATCTFGMVVSEEQIEWLQQIVRKDVSYYLLFDAGTKMEVEVLRRRLPQYSPMALPQGIKDPALLARKQVMELAMGLT